MITRFLTTQLLPRGICRALTHSHKNYPIQTTGRFFFLLYSRSPQDCRRLSNLKHWQYLCDVTFPGSIWSPNYPHRQDICCPDSQNYASNLFGYIHRSNELIPPSSNIIVNTAKVLYVGNTHLSIIKCFQISNAIL